MSRNATAASCGAGAASDLASIRSGLGIPGRVAFPASTGKAKPSLSRKQPIGPPTKEVGDFLGKQTVGKQKQSQTDNDNRQRNVFGSNPSSRPEPSHQACFHNPA